MLYPAAVALWHLREQWQQAGLYENRPVVSVGDDPAKLRGRKPRIERMQDAPCARDAEVALQVPVAVPGQRRDPLAVADAHTVECVHELLAAPGEMRIGMPVDAGCALMGDDLHVRKVTGSVPEEEPGIELDIHHRHRRLPLHFIVRCTPDLVLFRRACVRTRRGFASEDTLADLGASSVR